MSKTTAPYAISAIVWSGLGLTFAIIPFVNFLGIIFSAIGLSQTRRGNALYSQNRELYVCAGMYRAARICGLIGVILGSVLTFIFSIVIVVNIIDML